MTNTSMMEDDKFGGYYLKLQKTIRRVEKGKPIEMRKDEKNAEKKLEKEKYQGGMSLAL